MFKGSKRLLFLSRIFVALLLRFNIFLYCFAPKTPLVANLETGQFALTGEAYYSARMDSEQIPDFVCVEYIAYHDCNFSFAA
jgi:hypothetical protein